MRDEVEDRATRVERGRVDTVGTFRIAEISQDAEGLFGISGSTDHTY
jgi:hypothetical protein